MTPPLPSEPRRPNVSGELRASDSDRDAVVQQLNDAAAEGRIDLDELEVRLEHALTAKTFSELAVLTTDLPQGPMAAPQDRPPLVLNGGMNGVSRGPQRWDVPSRIIAKAGMGGVKLDFTRTMAPRTEIEVEAHGETGSVRLVIPDDWTVDTSGFEPGLGGVTDRTTYDRRPNAPLIRLTGTGGTGGVEVRHPNRWERRKLRND